MQDYEQNRLKDLRSDTDKTQKQLAEELGLHTTTYARWKQNPMSMKLPDLILIAEHYNVSIDYIAGRTNEKKPLP